MVTSRILRPASKLLCSSRPLAATTARQAFIPTASVFPSIASRRKYATPSGTKEMTVRDALNEALAEELEQNDKVFILGEEVAQYNGA
jgi:pyruvate dehydrogenase E1 component beta subunit